ncbi:Armadillo repeat-containing protein 6 [Bienertia sinuspersici]
MVPAMKKKISQEAFEEVVRENIDNFGMEGDEALQDAIQSLTLQGVDLSGIVTCVPGESSMEDNPVVKTLQDLKIQFANFDVQQLHQLSALLSKLADLCDPNPNNTDSNAAIASRNGGVELLTSICAKLSGIDCNDDVLISSLHSLTSLLLDVQSAETFHKCGGPDLIIHILNHHSHNPCLLNACFSVIAASATSNEILKESFISLKVDELFLSTLNAHNNANLPGLYDAIRILLTPDDFRVVASQVYGYARQFAKVGITDALVVSLHEGLTSPTLVSAAVALKAVAVNDEICRSIADKGGIDAVLRCIDDSGEQLNKSVARSCCSLLSKVMYIISVLSLRSPDNASRAMEAGAGDLAIEAMQKFPDAQLLQRNACLMIRNLVARNNENRKILLDNGIEKLIRKSKVGHGNCKAAATDALRDLGLDNYNL